MLFAMKVVFPSQLSEPPKVLEEILDQVKAAGFGQDAIFAIRLSLDEAMSNAIRHGNDSDPDKNVVVEYDITDDEFRASVTDEGCGFSPDQVPDPTLVENIKRPFGRGVMLMKAYMSEVIFNERGNRVTLVKRRNCPLPTRVDC